MTPAELNALVAEKVMGWDKNTVAGRLECWVTLEPDGLVHVQHPVESWSPFTSIADFIEVQQEMHRRGFWMRACSPFTPGEPWWVGFTPHSQTGWNGRPDFSTFGLSMSEAGSLAALKAVGVEIK